MTLWSSLAECLKRRVRESILDVIGHRVSLRRRGCRDVLRGSVGCEWKRRFVSTDAVAHAAQGWHFHVPARGCGSVQARWSVERVADTAFEWYSGKPDQV